MTTATDPAVSDFNGTFSKISAAIFTYFLLFMVSGSISHAKTNSVLIRGEITESSPKFYDKLTFTQRIPMKTGELVVVYTKALIGFRESYYSFTPSDPKAEKPKKGERTKWHDARGSRWLFPENTSTLKVTATPSKGGSLPPFELQVIDDSILYVAQEDGVLEVQMRSSNPVSVMFIMGKSFVGPPKISEKHIFKSTDPRSENQYIYHQHPYKTSKNKGLLVNIHGHPESTQDKSPYGLTVKDPQEADYEMFPDYSTTKRVYISSTIDGEYLIKPYLIYSAEQMEKTGDKTYTLEVTELPEIPTLLGIQKAP